MNNMKKQDFIIVGVVGVIALCLFLGLYVFNGSSGSYVQVEIDGRIVDTFDLDKDIEKTYGTDESYNVLQIKDGKATMTSASCPDQICVKHNSIYRSGESIICLPNKVVVSIENDKGADNEIDAVA